jgi:hypothetical protein
VSNPPDYVPEYGNIVVFFQSETIKASDSELAYCYTKVGKSGEVLHMANQKGCLKNYPFNKLYIPELLKY